ncbi:hypothetical protein C6V04_02705 [Burkholderia multivorans]|nr:hypothetical protein C6V04_02705 [Burkholderia multivorans]
MMQTTHARTPGSASTRRIAHRDAATRPGTSRGYPQILLASLWIGCAYDAQAFDRKRFVRVAENASRGSYVTPPGGDRRGRAPRAARLSTDFVGKRVDSLRIPRSSA